MKFDLVSEGVDSFERGGSPTTMRLLWVTWTARRTVVSSVFVSYARADSDRVRAVADRLRAHGYDAFVEVDKIQGGAAWRDALYDAIHQAFAVVLCATKTSVASKWVFSELVVAQYCRRPIVPLVLEPCDLPEFLESIERIDYTTDEEARYLRLAEALEDIRRRSAGVDQVAWPVDKCPYPGLQPFTHEYAPVFFGRERETRNALERLQQRDPPVNFLAFVGPSGSGKSSVVRAGILPALRAGRIPGSERWVITEPMTPGEAPFVSLAITMRRGASAQQSTSEIARTLREGPGALLDHVTDLLPVSDARVVITVDQLEELERQSDHAEAEAFARSLQAALGAPGRRLLVLATLRADFMSACLAFPGMADLLSDRIQTIGPMDRATMRRIVDGPTRIAGVEFEDGIIDELLDETGHPDALPHLAFMLRRLWEKAPANRVRVITRRMREEVGPFSATLAQAAQQLLERSDASQREAILKQLTRLADVDDSGAFTRRRVPIPSIPAALRPAILRFADEDARLLVASTDGQETQYLTVAHESLFRAWPQLLSHLDAEASRMRLRRDLERDASAWQREKMSPSLLWRGERLSAGLALIEMEGADAEDLRARFISASKESDSFTQTRESRLRAAFALDEVKIDPERAVLLALAAIDEYAWTAEAEHALRTAMVASRCRRRLAHGLPVNAAAFTLDGRLAVTGCGDGTARVWDVKTGIEQQVLRGHTGPAHAAAFSPDGTRVVTGGEDRTARLWELGRESDLYSLSGHEGPLRLALFTPDGSAVVTAAKDGTIRMWNAANGEPLGVLGRYHDAGDTVPISPDGWHAITTDPDGTTRVWDTTTRTARHVLQLSPDEYPIATSRDAALLLTSAGSTPRLWNLESGAEPTPLTGHSAGVWGAAFSPDGTLVATTSFLENTTRVWDVAGGKQLHVLHGEELRSMTVFDPAGRLLIVGSYRGTVRVWNVRTGTEQFVLAGHQGTVNAASFSVDGKVVTASSDGSARLWDVAARLDLLLAGHLGGVAAAVLSTDESVVVTASSDGTARIWDATTGHERRVLPCGDDAAQVLAVDMTTDGTLVATASEDGTVRFWEIVPGDVEGAPPAPRLLQGHDAAVRVATFSPDGALLLTAGDDGTARLWDRATGVARPPLRHDAPIKIAAFGRPDGGLVLTAADDGTARVWDSATGQQLHLLACADAGTGDGTQPAVFSPDGSLVLTACEDGTCKVWNVSTWDVVRTLRGHPGAGVTSIVFSNDGSLAVTGSSDATARVWDVGSGAELHVLQGHDMVLTNAAFNRDGTRVVTTSYDFTARVWDVETGGQCDVLPHKSVVWMAVFNVKGTRILTASEDKTARLWSFPPLDRVVAVARSRVDRSLTPEERKRFGFPVATALAAPAGGKPVAT